MSINTMKTLRFISVQPAIDYYTWQVEVMVQNFLHNGINGNHIDIVCAIRDNMIPVAWRKLAERYNMVRFFFYNDERVKPCYISSVRPNILKQHFTKFPELQRDAIMYHDCDIILTKTPQWDHLIQDDIWYLSDTVGYIGAEYIQSKKYGVYEGMCDIVGIDPAIPIREQKNSGGAQYLMKNVTADFWEKVEKDSEALYQFFLDHLVKHPETKEYHPIQKWTADMWAVLWNGWYFNHTQKVVPELEFAWPMHTLESWEKHTILHNAGVTKEWATKSKLFYKGDYMNTLPYNLSIEDFDSSLCTSKYVEAIISTGHTSCLL
jgi:hypothetical protein